MLLAEGTQTHSTCPALQAGRAAGARCAGEVQGRAQLPSASSPVCQIQSAQPLGQRGGLQVRWPLLLHARRAHRRAGAPWAGRARPHVLRWRHAARSRPHVLPREAGRRVRPAHVCMLRAVPGWRRRRRALRGPGKHAWLLHGDRTTWRWPSMHGREGGARAVLWRWRRPAKLAGVWQRWAVARRRVLAITRRRAVARWGWHSIRPRRRGASEAVCLMGRRRWHPTQVPRRQRALGVWLLRRRTQRAVLSWQRLLLACGCAGAPEQLGFKLLSGQATLQETAGEESTQLSRRSAPATKVASWQQGSGMHTY